MGQATAAQAATVATVDKKAKVSSGDTTPDYLETKLVAGAGITLTKNNPGANETISINASSTDAFTLKTTVDDTTPGYLNNKLLVGTGLVKSTLTPGANERIKIDVNNRYMEFLAGDLGTSPPGSYQIAMKEAFPSIKLKAAVNVAATGTDITVLGIRMLDTAYLMANCGVVPVYFVETSPTIGAPCFTSYTAGKATITPLIDSANFHYYIGTVVSVISSGLAYVALNIKRSSEHQYGRKRAAIQAYIHTLSGYGCLWWTLNNILRGASLNHLPMTDHDIDSNNFSFSFEENYGSGSPFIQYKQSGGLIDSCLKLKTRTSTYASSSIWCSYFINYSPLTHLIWVRRDEAGSHRQTLLTTNDGYSQTIFGVSIDVNYSAGYLGFAVRTNMGTQRIDLLTTNYLPGGSWKLLGLTYDASLGSNQLKAFVNGVQEGQATIAGTITSTARCHIGDISTDMSTFPGKSGDYSFAEHMNFDHALTAAEQLAIYNLATAA